MRKGIRGWIVGAFGVTLALWMAAVSGLPGQQKTDASKLRPAKTLPHPASALLSTEDSRRFAERFAKEVWPLLTRKEADCLACHGTNSATPLKMFADPAATF